MIQLTLNILLHAAAVTAGAQDYATAYKEMNETGRPLVVLIGADWCPGCRVMKQAALPEVEKMGGLSHVSYAYVNADHQSKLAGKLMQGSSIPQLILYHRTAKGWQRQQLTGAHSVTDIQAFLQRAADQSVPKISSRQ